MRSVKVLLITGLLAEDLVKRYAQESNVETEVLTLKIPVAAFLTPEKIVKAFDDNRPHNIGSILIPGLIRGDAKVISDALDIPAFKGPKYAADLPTVLDMIGEVELSTVIPACELLKEKLEQKALEELKKVEANRESLLKKPGNMLIKDLAMGKDFPMRVVSEIVDAPLMSKEEIQRLAKLYVDSGADIVDVGMIAGESRPSDAKMAIKAVKSVVNVPVSIDTLNPTEIIAAVSAGADVVLSGDKGNLEEIAPFVRNSTVIILPSNQRKGYFPTKIQERTTMLEENIELAKKLGITKVVGDLVLEPINVLESFVAFREFANRNPDVPLLAGVSNVTELMDADSVGVNAMLARLCSEVGVNLLLTTEKTPKAKGSIKEMATAAKMMFLSKRRGSAPEDLGIDLLLLKDKLAQEPYDRVIENQAQLIFASEKSAQNKLDLGGNFRIEVDHIDEIIVATHFVALQEGKSDIVVKGKNAKDVYTKIVELGLVTLLDHAAYLGSELMKAEIALKTGKVYVQDEPLFGK